MRTILGHLIYLDKKFVVENFGVEKYQEIVSQITDPEIRETLLRPIMSNQKYNIEAHAEYCRSALKILGEKDFIRNMQYNAERGLTGFFGLATKVMPVGVILKEANLMWRKIFSDGELSCLKNDQEEIIMHLANFQTTPDHLKAITWWMEHFLHVVSGKNIKGSLEVIDQSNNDFVFKIY